MTNHTPPVPCQGKAIVWRQTEKARLAERQQVNGGSQATARGGHGERHHSQGQVGVCHGGRGLLQAGVPEALRHTLHHTHTQTDRPGSERGGTTSPALPSPTKDANMKTKNPV